MPKSSPLIPVRHVMAVIWILCGVYGVYQLATANIELIRFWDEADLVLDTGVPQFESEGGRIGAISYATRKIGYAYPIKFLREAYGSSSSLHWNLFWLLLIVVVPIPGVRSWHSYALRFGAVLGLPYTMKYVTMINPTIQSMALWILFATIFVYWRQARERAGSAKHALAGIIGVLGGGIVLTDFKWLPFVVASIILLLLIDPTESVTTQRGWARWRQIIRLWVFPNAVVMLAGIPVVLGAAALVFRPYGEMVYAMLFALPEQVGVVRPAISENLLIHLWYLGGMGIVLGAVGGLLMRFQTNVLDVRRSAPYWMTAVLVCAAFSFVVWPRGARMFAPALVLLISVAAMVVAPRWLTFETKRTRFASIAVLLLITTSMLLNVGQVGTMLTTPTGLTPLKAHIAAHTIGPLGDGPDEEPPYTPSLMGGYMLPLMIMRASPDGDMLWYSPAVGLREPSNWAFLNPVTDAFTIEEQASGGAVSPEWKQDQYFMRESMERHGQTLDTFPAPFYTTPYYICELTFQGNRLIDAIKSKSVSEWRVVYIGNFYDRPFPGTSTEQNAP